MTRTARALRLLIAAVATTATAGCPGPRAAGVDPIPDTANVVAGTRQVDRTLGDDDALSDWLDASDSAREQVLAEVVRELGWHEGPCQTVRWRGRPCIVPTAVPEGSALGFVVVPLSRCTSGPPTSLLLVSQTEVPLSVWNATMPETSRRRGPLDAPVTGLTWAEIQEFCSRTGTRLPSASEWRQAAGGSREIGGRDSWVRDDSGPYASQVALPEDVGVRRPNALGLFGMTGNVSEACTTGEGDGLDRTAARPQVLVCGTSFRDPPALESEPILRRVGASAGADWVGFRVVVRLDRPGIAPR